MKARTLFILALIALLFRPANAGQVTGTFATPGGSFIQNGTITFTLSQLAVKTDATQTVAPMAGTCYTSTDGSVVGLPNPLALPSMSATTGTMTSGVYYEVITYWNASGETIASPEQTIVLSSSQGIQTAGPALQPTNGSGYNIYIGITSGGEVLQAHVTGFASTSIGSLVGGASPPVSNSSTCSLAFNDTFIPAYTTYQMTFTDSTGSPIPGFPQSYYFQGSTVNLNTMLPASGLSARFPQPIVASPVNTSTQSINSNLSLNNHNLLGVGSASVTTLGVTGTSTLAAVTNTSEGTPKFNRVVWLDGTVNTTLAQCLAAAATAKSVCEVPPNYSETVAADITPTNDTGLHFNGVSAINMGTHQFKCAGGTCNDFFIDSDVPFGSNGSPSAGVVFTYTGTTTPFSFGDTAADSFGLSLRNFTVNVAGGGAAVSAITLNRFHPVTLQNLRLIGVTGQVGVNFVGTGGYSGNADIINLFANGFTSCVKMTAEGNFNRIYAACPNTPAGGKAIDIADGNGNKIFVDAENGTTGVNFGNSANTFGNRVEIYGQGNTTDAVFGAASVANTVDNVGANCGGIVPTVADSGTHNSFWNPCKYQMDVNGNLTLAGKLTTGSAGLSINGGTALVNQTGTGTSVVTNTSPTISGTATVQRIATAGTSATSCAVTGAGASGSCSFPVVSTDSYGIMRIAAAGAGPAATGTLTLTLSSSIGTFAVCTFTPSSASTAWNARVSALQTNYSATAPIMTWDNNSVALVAASSYDITYKCEGH